MVKFEVGQTYSVRSICDHTCVTSVTIASRTEKTLTTARGKRFRIKVDCEQIETFKPWGSYSMAPIIRANKVLR